MVAGMTGPSHQRVAASGKFLRLGADKFVVRGVTYGPFAPDAAGVTFPDGQRIRGDIERIASLGCNVIRVYDLPTRELIDACASNGIRLLVTVPWTQHVDFFHDRVAGEGAERAVREAVRLCRQYEPVMGYLVANEIESTLVRWMGPAKVSHFIEKLIDIARREDGRSLFAYPNYPSTEYLRPRNADFVAFNVYLESARAFGRYLERLQNLAGEKPLIISEFGIDVKSQGAQRQADTYAWHWAEVAAAGASGSVWFSYTDDWHRGDAEVLDWEFGMVTRDRREREICGVVRRWCKPGGMLEKLTRASSGPRVSVVVCTYNGTRTLRDCLSSLRRLRYPDYEAILVDDGSGDGVAAIARDFPEVRYIRQEHAGLSAARNRGAQEATGDIIAYTDDDCVVDEDWLHHLSARIARGNFAAVGGPNVPPAPKSLVQACVAAAPGGPSHVLLSDREAEHIPGCNLAVYRSAFEAIGGFRPEFVAAGDDVDFCWRLQDAGMKIGFSPAAMVWHYRRARVSDYFRQQRGYGKAEALLMRRHPGRFGAVGGARWVGVVYPPAGGIPVVLGGAPRIYQGLFGHAPFQRIYGGDIYEVGYMVSSPHWLGMGLLFAVGGMLSPWLAIAGAAMILANVVQALQLARVAEIAEPWDGPAGRFCLVALTWLQPLVRGWARYFSGLGYTRLNRNLPEWPRVTLWPRKSRLRLRVTESFWNEAGKTRDALFEPLARDLAAAGWECVPGHGWERWDLEIRRPSRLWSVRLGSVTEYHGGGKCLTRVRLYTVGTSLFGLTRNVILVAALLAGLFGGWAALLAVLAVLAGFLLTALAGGGLMLLSLRGRVRRVAAETGVAGNGEPAGGTLNV